MSHFDLRNWNLDCQVWLAIAETVWKRVIDPMMRMILLGGAAFSFLLGLNVEGTAKDIRFSLCLISSFVTLVIIFVGSIEIPRDLSTKNVQFFLSKPLSRGTYLLGKFLGIIFLGLIFFSIFSVTFACGNIWHSNWNAGVFWMTLLQLTLQILPLAAVLMVISVFLPEMPSTAFGITFYLIGFLVFLVPAVIRLFLPGFLRPVFMVVYYILPNWLHYLWTWEGGNFFFFLTLLAAYSVSYCTVAIFVANFWFSRRDLN